MKNTILTVAGLLLVAGCAIIQTTDLKSEIESLRPELTKSFYADSVRIQGPNEVCVCMSYDAAHTQQEIIEFIQSHTTSEVKIIFELE